LKNKIAGKHDNIRVDCDQKNIKQTPDFPIARTFAICNTANIRNQI
jgi:hypothetical protein